MSELFSSDIYYGETHSPQETYKRAQDDLLFAATADGIDLSAVPADWLLDFYENTARLENNAAWGALVAALLKKVATAQLEESEILQKFATFIPPIADGPWIEGLTSMMVSWDDDSRPDNMLCRLRVEEIRELRQKGLIDDDGEYRQALLAAIYDSSASIYIKYFDVLYDPEPEVLEQAWNTKGYVKFNDSHYALPRPTNSIVRKVKPGAVKVDNPLVFVSTICWTLANATMLKEQALAVQGSGFKVNEVTPFIKNAPHISF
jgi:hypothetical protein